MAKESRDHADVDMLEWAWLLERLRAASPHRVRAIFRTVRAMVEGQELVASYDDQLPLRETRPTRRYNA